MLKNYRILAALVAVVLSFDVGGVWASTCSDLTGGEYLLPSGDVSDSSECYKECEVACVEPSGCPTNFASGRCTYDTSAMITGKQYYGTDTCAVDDDSCPIDGTVTDSGNRCVSSYYMKESEDVVMECVLCTTLSEDLGYYEQYGFNYRYSVNATLSNGPGACYASVNGLLVCDYANWQILGADFLPTGESVNVCPENATCVDSEEQPTSAYAWYPSYVAVPTSFCTFDFTCNPGYVANTDTTTGVEYGYKRLKTGSGQTKYVTATCDLATYTMTLDDTIGAGGSGAVYQKYITGWYSDADATVATDSVVVPTLKNYTFLGYFTAETGGDMVIDNAGTIVGGTDFVENTTLYAQWLQNVNKCVEGSYYDTGVLTTCITPYYCPGEGDVVVEETGCNSTCPTGSITGGNGETRQSGATTVNQCFKTFTETDESGYDLANGTAEWECSWKGTVDAGEYSDCTVNVLTCDAGYYKLADAQACADVTSGYYSPEPNLERTACPEKTNYTVGSDGTRAANTNCYISCATYLPTVEHATKIAVSGDANKYFDATTGDYTACEYAVECETGYDAVNGANPQCVPRVVSITLDDMTGSGGSGTIYQKYATGWYSDADANSEIANVSVPTLKNHNFLGYFNAETTGEQIIDANGAILANNTEYVENVTLYAQWELDVEQCVSGSYFNLGTLTTCATPYYCSGEGYVIVGETGCNSTCPTGSITGGNGETRQSGATTVNQCFKTFTETDESGYDLANGTAEWDCAWKGTVDAGEYSDCTVNVLTCDAGYYKPADAQACADVTSGYYSSSPNLERTACPVKTNYTVGSDGTRAANTNCYISCASYLPTVEHATKIAVSGDEYKYFDAAAGDYAACEYAVECETGYDAVNGANPHCVPRVYSVNLNKNGGAGNVVESVSCTFDSGVCALPGNAGLTKAGYNIVAKWCTNADGSGVCYDAGGNVATNLSADATSVTLYALWAPAIFEITLHAPDADENATQGPVYLKYATGWYADADATTPITNIGTNLPGKGGESYRFVGYKIGDVFIIDGAGTLQISETVLKITTTDATASVVWSAESTKCEAGTYYPGTSSKCFACEQNNYCPGGTFQTDSGEIGGLNPCPNYGLSDGGTNATNIGVCYKEQLAYLSPSKKASGTQTCFYGTVAYDTNCYDIAINSCVAGYWYDETQTKTDCVVVGENYYSADGELTRAQCPDGGNTEGKTTSEAITECVKRVDTYQSATGNARGSHICYAGNDGAYNQYCRQDSIEIDWCAGGYWYNETQTKTDCVEVGENHYSGEGDLTRSACPNNGTTTMTTASTPQGICKKSTVYPGLDYDGPAVHGYGTQGCYYDSASDGKLFGSETSDGYLLNCSDIVMNECDSGYYWATNKGTVCSKVDYNNYGPVSDINNSGRLTARAACPDNGITETDVSGDISECFKEQLACVITNGTGENTCNYSDISQGYIDNCTTCIVTDCDVGFSQVGNACISCPKDNVCYNGVQQTCAVLTDNEYIWADAGTTDIAYCWRECALAEHAYAMLGRDYYDAVDTCEISICVAGYTLSNGVCVECPADSVCTPDNPNPQACATLTNGEYPLSMPGAASIDDCYKKCEEYALRNGTALPRTETMMYPDVCEYDGISNTGNPCEITGDICIETSCIYNFELIDNMCIPCNREHAISYKKNGNCVVESCENGYHPNGQACEDDIVKCDAPFAVAATQKWDSAKNAFAECIITECADEYHLIANTCQANEQVCELEHGIGVRVWDAGLNKWGECVAIRCNPGYTNDSTMTNEKWEQCGRCNNAYAENGEIAVSSYVQGCEIAACMYQGEKYALDNNECVFICPTITLDEDGTGSQKWNNTTKKCERTCQDGYMQW